ncbi:MAG: hypothetical protein JEY94_18885 [Melioribacteraceae bacterium]|nr:hypothetical protein [Melioribacteraceae bacterium]
MKSCIIESIMVLALTILCSGLHAEDAVNPFTQFSAPEDGVNIITGDASFSIPMTTMPSAAGLNIPVGLSYSSNVMMAVKTKNDAAPTGWVGLGWALGYGHIMVNYKGRLDPIVNVL